MLKVIKVGGYIVFTTQLEKNESESEHEKQFKDLEDKFEWKFTSG